MKKIYLLKKLERFSLFTQNDIAKIINKNSNYVKTLLYRLSKESLIKKIERGKYTVHDDILIFASHINPPSYFGLWTSLRYYNLTQQQPRKFFVVCSVKRKNIKLKDFEIVFVSTKNMFGYKKERYDDFDIFIADPEKTIIDCLLFKIPINDIKYALDDNINLEKLSEYARRTKNISLIKRLGYLLESKGENSYGLKALDNNYILLNYSGKRKGKKDKKWKVIVNI